tara:strand:+ start:13 stop:843 length:831 start_codon:yes stop_codon:yes gene_type:complete
MNKEIYWEKALKKTKLSIISKSLFPLHTTDITSKLYKGKDFVIRELDITKFKKNTIIGPKNNPFKPWEKILEIDSIGNYHQLILNKYPVQLGHILLITNDWKEQNGWIDLNDWEAIKKVNKDTTGLWFFNSGPLAGASQPHRHIQLLRREPFEINCPREKWILTFGNMNYKNKKFNNNIIIKKFSKGLNNEDINKVYIDLSNELGLGDPKIDRKPKYPYNLLFTNNWMVLIKRKTDNLHGISVNALGFAGYILVTERSDISYLKKYGPEKLLENFI